VKKSVLALLLALVLAAPAFAQTLPPAQCTVLQQLGAKFGALNKGTDEERRQFALIVAEQFAFSFPGDGWGAKSAGPGRPPSKDVVARNRAGTLDGWDLVDGTTRAVRCTSHVDLPGQLFIEVDAVDHLGAPVIDPPPTGGSGASAALQQQQLELLLQIVKGQQQQLEAQRLQSEALAVALRDLKAEIAKGIRVRF
jgi:hypothetical protein